MFPFPHPKFKKKKRISWLVISTHWHHLMVQKVKKKMKYACFIYILSYNFPSSTTVSEYKND